VLGGFVDGLPDPVEGVEFGGGVEGEPFVS